MEERWVSQSPYERFIHSGNAIKHTHSSIDHMRLRSETKMAAPRKRSHPSRIRHHIETECETEAEKEAFSRRFQRMRELLSPRGSVLVDNGTILNAMFDIVEREVGGQSSTTPQTAQTTLSPSMMRNSGEALASDRL